MTNKKTHETQPSEMIQRDDQKIFTPLENLQKIESGGVYKRNSFNLSSFPKGIRWIGYFMFGTIFVMIILSFLVSIFMG